MMETNIKGTKVEFTYPEGLQKVASKLTFLPEEQRMAMAVALITTIPKV